MQGKWLLNAGFEPDAGIELVYSVGKLEVRLGQGHKVSSKMSGTIPVIDINNETLADIFDKVGTLQIVAGKQQITITPAHTVQQIAARQQNMKEGSLFSGGGFLTEAARQAGLTPAYAVELDEQYAEVYERNHPEAAMFNMSVEQVPVEVLKTFGPLHVLTLGIPCEPHSAIRTLNKGGQEKRDKSLPNEAHDLGDMVFWALRAIEASNPHTVIIENVPDFLKSGSGFILTHALRRMGYNVDSRIVNPVEHGELTARKRAVIVARTGAAVVWPEQRAADRKLGDILEDNNEWFNRETKNWLYDHWDKQAAKGNGFPSQQVSADSTHVGTIKKRYFAGQGDNPVVCHPTLEGTHRWFTLTEVKRLHGIPDNYFVGDSKTLAGELMGQGVVVSTMRDIIKANL
jgi:site-specific DNA-cytosine methylase